MEDMTQEEKARAYDEAIKKVNDYYEGKTKLYSDVDKTLNYLFPELAKSKDERIRQFLIHEVEETNDEIMSYRNMNKKDVLAWIEKQGEHANFRNKIQVGDKVTRNKDGVLVNLSQLNRVAKKDNKQGEQKPADKVEPKFKVGDWIVCCDYEPEQIIGISTNSYYEMSNGDSRPFYMVDNNHNIRLWTLADAKDGDVLCTYECCEPKIVFILKGAPKKPYVLGYHCYYNIMYPHFGSDSEKGCLAPNDEDVTPATKEQRDLLFQKMKEEGYEWDIEKKELKKIEQKDKVLTDFESVLFSAFSDGWQQYLRGKELDVAQWAKEHSAEILEAATVKSAEWSEEDKRHFELIILICEEEQKAYQNDSLPYINIGKAINWLKSLKGRIQQNPKWNEEDGARLQRIIDFLWYNRKGDTDTIYQQEQDIEWLKSLRDKVRYLENN